MADDADLRRLDWYSNRQDLVQQSPGLGFNRQHLVSIAGNRYTNRREILMKGTLLPKTNSKHLVQEFSISCTPAHGITELDLNTEQSHETVADANAGGITWIISKGSTRFFFTNLRSFTPAFNMLCAFAVLLFFVTFSG